jgi:hypothetical protein
MSTKLTAGRNLFELLRPLATRRATPFACATPPADTAPPPVGGRAADRPTEETAAARRASAAGHRDHSPRAARMKLA